MGDKEFIEQAINMVFSEAFLSKDNVRKVLAMAIKHGERKAGKKSIELLHAWRSKEVLPELNIDLINKTSDFIKEASDGKCR